jgi:release factor glutamine methyltransferase
VTDHAPDHDSDRMLEQVVDRLVDAGCVAAEEEADELVAAAPDGRVLDGWVRRRERGEPLAWITGSVVFCGRRLRVQPGVYVPRPQTELVAQRAADLLPTGGRAADLCTGSGAVAAHLRGEVPGATVIGVDADRRAVACARANGVPALVGDLGRPLRSGAFDVVTSVAPYVPTGELRFLPADVQRYEPGAALDGGPDGLDLVRRVVAAAARLLRPGGWLVIELGGDQDDALAPSLVAHGFGEGTSCHDEDGDLRGVAARRPV